MIGLFQNQIKDLPALNRYRYEKIFRMYKNNGIHYFYNVLQTLYLPDQIDETKVYYITVKQKEPWTMISFRAYKTIELWWLLCLLNKIYNPSKTQTFLTRRHPLLDQQKSCPQYY